MIKRNKHIQSICVHGRDVTINQLEDYTAIILRCHLSVPVIRDVLHRFHKASGLKTNIEAF